MKHENVKIWCKIQVTIYPLIALSRYIVAAGERRTEVYEKAWVPVSNTGLAGTFMMTHE